MRGEVEQVIPVDGDGESAGQAAAPVRAATAVLVVRAATLLVQRLTGVRVPTDPSVAARPTLSGALNDVDDGSDSGAGLDRLIHMLLAEMGAPPGVSLSECTDSELIDVLAEFQTLRAVTGAAEAHAQVVFEDGQRAAAQQRGVPKSDQGKGIADQLALVRGVPIARAANELTLARGLVRELPETYARLASGSTREDVAYAVARETVCLVPADRAKVDRAVAPRIDERTRKTRAASMARAEAARVDAESVVARIAMAERDRNVTLRPAPDAMVYLSALMPVKQGVAAYAALCRLADQRRTVGDTRSRGQFMADEVFTRLTGLSEPSKVPVEIQLVMPASTLLPGSTLSDPNASDPTPGNSTPGNPTADDSKPGDSKPGETASRIGEHVIPADIARAIALIPDDEAQRWIRRVFTDPISGEVRAVDERRRAFSGATRRAITLRDQVCRGCGAPIREIDHVTAYARGGPTTIANGQGHCQRCNRTKELPGWETTAVSHDGSHTVTTTTPTGHRYTSQAPPVLYGLTCPPSLDDPPAHSDPSHPGISDASEGGSSVGASGVGARDADACDTSAGSGVGDDGGDRGGDTFGSQRQEGAAAESSPKFRRTRRSIPTAQIRDLCDRFGREQHRLAPLTERSATTSPIECRLDRLLRERGATAGADPEERPARGQPRIK